MKLDAGVFNDAYEGGGKPLTREMVEAAFKREANVQPSPSLMIVSRHQADDIEVLTLYHMLLQNKTIVDAFYAGYHARSKAKPGFKRMSIALGKYLMACARQLHEAKSANTKSQ